MMIKKQCTALAIALAAVAVADIPGVSSGYVVQQPVVVEQPVVVQQPVVVAGPNGRILPRGMMWCSKCEGYGYNRTWYGWAKKCHICDGTGMRPLPPPPPPPKPVIHGHHGHHGRPAPKPVVKPGPKPGPKPSMKPGPESVMVLVPQ